MAIDTAAKRFSMINMGAWPSRTLPIPDGSIDAADRAHFLGLYSGIALAEPVEVAGTTGATPVQALVWLLRHNNAVASVVAARIESEEIPQTTRMPFLSVQESNDAHEHHMVAADGVAHETVQVDSYARTRAQAEGLADKVRLALDGFVGTVRVNDDIGLVIASCRLGSDNSDFVRDLTGSDTGAKRVSHEYEVWYPETIPTF